MSPTVCPSCHNKYKVVKVGTRKTAQELVQKYLCRSCNSYFSDKKSKYSTYPLPIILNTITIYNLGNSIRETNKIINKRYHLKVPPTTLHSWINKYQQICTFTNIRKKYKIDPKTVIRTKKLQHRQVYAFKYHQLKLNFAGKPFPQLKQYIRDIHKKCPDNIFQKGPRCSTTRPDIAPPKIKTIRSNNALKLTELALNLSKTNRDRHQHLQDFMLTNDSATIAIEIPVYILPGELRSKELKPLDLQFQEPLTGHIDLLQVRYNNIHILDYKPEAKRSDKRAIEQLSLYALALSKRTNLPLKIITCAYFNENNYFQFNL